MIRPIDIRPHGVSAKRRFDEMMFRENNVTPLIKFEWKDRKIFVREGLVLPEIQWQKLLIGDALQNIYV